MTLLFHQQVVCHPLYFLLVSLLPKPASLPFSLSPLQQSVPWTCPLRTSAFVRYSIVRLSMYHACIIVVLYNSGKMRLRNKIWNWHFKMQKRQHTKDDHEDLDSYPSSIIQSKTEKNERWNDVDRSNNTSSLPLHSLLWIQEHLHSKVGSWIPRLVGLLWDDGWWTSW